MGVKSEDEFIPATHLLDLRIDWILRHRGIPYLDWGIVHGDDWERKQLDLGPYLPARKPSFSQSLIKNVKDKACPELAGDF